MLYTKWIWSITDSLITTDKTCSIEERKTGSLYRMSVVSLNFLTIISLGNTIIIIIILSIKTTTMRNVLHLMFKKEIPKDQQNIFTQNK